jgi:hypothetical protein
MLHRAPDLVCEGCAIKGHSWRLKEPLKSDFVPFLGRRISWAIIQLCGLAPGEQFENDKCRSIGSNLRIGGNLVELQLEI